VRRVLRVYRGCLELLVEWAILVLLVLAVLLGFRACQGLRDRLAAPAAPAPPARQVPRAP
jgi:hypothetical protein